MSNPIENAISTLKSGIENGNWDGNMQGSGVGESERTACFSALSILESVLRVKTQGKCDCARGHFGSHKPTCPEFAPWTSVSPLPLNPTASERVDICRERVGRRKRELDTAVHEYALACQELAVAVERAERASEIPTEPNNDKPLFHKK